MSKQPMTDSQFVAVGRIVDNISASLLGKESEALDKLVAEASRSRQQLAKAREIVTGLLAAEKLGRLSHTGIDGEVQCHVCGKWGLWGGHTSDCPVTKAQKLTEEMGW